MVADSQDLPPCKSSRLCKAVDVGLIRRYPKRRLEFYAERAREIEAAYANTALWLAARQTRLVSGSDFLETVLAVHRRVFQQGDPQIAGAIRRHEVSFGRGRLNQRQGLAPEQIVSALLNLDLGAAPQNVREAALWGANFLRRFFVIHPFADGNGRVGRLLMTSFIEHGGLLTVSAKHDRSSNKYLCALEYAHRHYDDVTHERYPLHWLAKYLEDQLSMASTDEEEPSDLFLLTNDRDDAGHG